MLDSAGLIKRTCSALCLKEGLERAARTVHRSRCMVPIKFRSFKSVQLSEKCTQKNLHARNRVPSRFCAVFVSIPGVHIF